MPESSLWAVLLVSGELTQAIRDSGSFLFGQTDESHPLACGAGYLDFAGIEKNYRP